MTSLFDKKFDISEFIEKRSTARLDYFVDLKIASDGSSATVTHRHMKIKFLDKQLTQGNAFYCFTISARNSGYRQIFLSQNPSHLVQWSSEIADDDFSCRAVIVVAHSFTYEFSAHDQVADEWIGKRISFPKGARLLCSIAPISSSAALHLLHPQQRDGLLTYRVDDNLHDGGFYVEIGSTNGGWIDVYMSTNLYEIICVDPTGGRLYCSVLAHILSSAFWKIREGVRDDDKIGFAKRHHRIVDLLNELTGGNFLDQVGGANFQPDRVATNLVSLVFGTTRRNRPSQLREFDVGKFKALRTSLIEKEGDEAQVELLQSCVSQELFLSWVEKKLKGGEVGRVEPAVFSRNLTEGEFKGMNELLEREASQLWSEIPLSVACRSSFWGMVTVNHIVKGIIEPSYLASVLGKPIKGVELIESAIVSNDKKKIDEVTRTILRKLSGLPEARGVPRSVSCDCPFARAWWRQRILEETVALTGGDRQAISATLYRSKSYWEKLLMLPQMEVTKSSPARFGDNKVRTAFIWALSDYDGNYDYGSLFRSQGLIDNCMHRFAKMSLEREFGAFEVEELKVIIKEEVIEPEHRAF